MHIHSMVLFPHNICTSNRNLLVKELIKVYL